MIMMSYHFSTCNGSVNSQSLLLLVFSTAESDFMGLANDLGL